MRLFFLFFIILQINCSNPAPPEIAALPIAEPIAETLFPPSPVLVFDYDTLKWTEIVHLNSDIVIDLKYATTENFVEEKMYDCPRAFLRPKVANALLAVHETLKKENLGLKIYDAYRPLPIQSKLWKKVPDRRYVTPPSKGSMHNRGAAVDITIVDSEGNELEMGTPYDFFGREAWPEYQDLPKEVLKNRKLLKKVMLQHGFKGIRTEWWHFSFPGTGASLSEWIWEC